MTTAPLRAGEAITTVSLRRRTGPDTSSGTLATLDRGSRVTIVRLLQGETVLTIGVWAELADGSFCWSGGLAQPEPGAETVATPGLAARAAAIAIAEWEFFGRSRQSMAGATVHRGHKETEPGFFERIGDYWRLGPKLRRLDGRNTGTPWSAAFISYVLRAAGAGARFGYSARHSSYIWRSILLRDDPDEGYWGVRLHEATPSVGDLVCWARQPGVDYDHQLGGTYFSHTDLVVAVGDTEIEVIGGNVSNSVTRRPLALDAGGHLKPVTIGGEPLFALMKCRIS